MKCRLFCICAVLVAVASSGVYSAQSGHKGKMQPKATGKAAGQMAQVRVAPAAAPDANAPVATQTVPAPAAVGAGPSMSAAQATNTSGMAIAVEGDSVYVVQGGMLYKFPKGDVNCNGTAFPPPCPPAAGPACPASGGVCSGMTYIPGPPSQLAVTTLTPCTPQVPVGAGPGTCNNACGNCSNGCNTACNTCNPCPPQAPACPSSIVSCATPAPCPCPPKAPKPNCGVCGAEVCEHNCPPNYTISTTTVPAGTGMGACTLPAVAQVSACTQQTLTSLQGLSGIEADKAYLQGVIGLNMQALAVSNEAAVHLGTTNLQDYATNTIADSRSRVAKAEKWLRTKYCLTVQSCASYPAPGFDICANRPGAAYDAAYRKAVTQFYIDEIALSQAEIANGLDCQVKAWAAEIIRSDQDRISILTRCNNCGI